MMTFIGISLANILDQGAVPGLLVQRAADAARSPFDELLPAIPGTRIHVGVLIAAGVVLRRALRPDAHVVRPAAAGPRARTRARPRTSASTSARLIVTAFLSAARSIGVAAAVEILGIWGYMRADWNPAYGDAVIPFVFLARLNALAVDPVHRLLLRALRSAATSPRRTPSLPTDFLLVLVGLILLFMTVIEYLGRRRELGRSYLTPGLREAARAAFTETPK